MFVRPFFVIVRAPPNVPEINHLELNQYHLLRIEVLRDFALFSLFQDVPVRSLGHQHQQHHQQHEGRVGEEEEEGETLAKVIKTISFNSSKYRVIFFTGTTPKSSKYKKVNLG